MAWLNPGVKINPRCRLINKLMSACSSMALVLTFGHMALGMGRYGSGQYQAIPPQAIINISFEYTGYNNNLIFLCTRILILQIKYICDNQVKIILELQWFESHTVTVWSTR